MISKLSLPSVNICQVSPSDTPLLDAKNTVEMRWMLFFYFFFFTAAVLASGVNIPLCKAGKNTELKYHFRWNYLREIKE